MKMLAARGCKYYKYTITIGKKKKKNRQRPSVVRLQRSTETEIIAEHKTQKTVFTKYAFFESPEMTPAG